MGKHIIHLMKIYIFIPMERVGVILVLQVLLVTGKKYQNLALPSLLQQLRLTNLWTHLKSSGENNYPSKYLLLKRRKV